MGRVVSTFVAAVVAFAAPLGGGGAADAGAAASGDASSIDFARQVQPIFRKHCWGCHGPDEQEGDLRLDRREDALQGGGSGPAWAPGDSAASLLIEYVAAFDSDVVMPPDGPRLTPNEVTVLRQWIDQGADWPKQADGPAKALRHWAFQPVVRPRPPATREGRWQLNAVDAFVLSQLEQQDVAPSRPADRATLFRRLHLDLLGLPPTVEAIDAFLNDDRPDAYDRCVDQLLASPHFGERWGRDWLDLARYADSDGYEDDRYRPDAWRFRDWVINAFNDDLPFDQFTFQQIAGDLAPAAGYADKVAAGFHRMTLFNRAGVGRNDEEFRVKTAKDRASTVATTWLGLTIACAECHSHKYDPIPHRDYYRFYAYFDNLLDANIPAPPLGDDHQARYEAALRDFEEGQSRAKAALAAYERELFPARLAAWERQVARSQLPREVAHTLAVAPVARTDEQSRELADYFRAIDAEYQRLDAAVLKGDQIPNNRPQPPSREALSVRENGERRTTYVQVRGDFRSLGEEVRAGAPRFLSSWSTSGHQDRRDLARWLTAPENPLTSRVAANHVWKRLFGRGLVRTPENFGMKGQPPTHPQLLDWLAAELLENGWSRKRLIRLIVCSQTYRQSSQQRTELSERDPQNRWLARQNRFRVEAEIVRDLGLAVSGVLSTAMGGPSIQPPLPASLLARQELKTERFMAPSGGAEQYRRGVYVNVQRTFTYPLMNAFDAVDANVACARRERSNTPLQALMLLNDPVFAECSRALSSRLLNECRGDVNARIHYAFRVCLGRRPVGVEAEVVRELYDEHESMFAADPALARDLLGETMSPAETPLAAAAAWVAVARTLLNTDELITRE